VRLRLFRARRRLRDKLSMALKPAKLRQVRGTAARMDREQAECEAERSVPLTAFAEFACGD